MRYIGGSHGTIEIDDLGKPTGEGDNCDCKECQEFGNYMEYSYDLMEYDTWHRKHWPDQEPDGSDWRSYIDVILIGSMRNNEYSPADEYARKVATGEEQ